MQIPELDAIMLESEVAAGCHNPIDNALGST